MQQLYMIRLGLISLFYVVCSAQANNTTSTPAPGVAPEEEQEATQTYIWTFVAIGLLVSCCVFSALLYRKFFGPCDMGGMVGGAAAAATASNATSQTNPVQQVCAIPGMQPTVSGGATSSKSPKSSPKSTPKEKKPSPKPKETPTPSPTPSPAPAPWTAPWPSAPPIFIHPVSPHAAHAPYSMAPHLSRSTPAMSPQVPSCPPPHALEPFAPMHSPGYLGQPPPHAWGAPAGIGSHYPYDQQPHSF